MTDRKDTAGRWPDLFLVGAAHAGTAALRRALACHPCIAAPEPEQPHFFAAVQPASRFARVMPVVTDPKAYQALYAGLPDGAFAIDASTSNLWSMDAPGRIRAMVPDARIVILLRDPVERAWAHHRADRATGLERRGFLRAVRDSLGRPGRWGRDPMCLDAGRYADGLERYLDLFGRDRVQVHFAETFAANPAATVLELLAWLDLDPESALPITTAMPDGWATVGARRPWHRSGFPAAGATVASATSSAQVTRSEPSMDPTIRRLLEEVYLPDVTRVSDLLGVIPPWSVTPVL